MNRLAAEKRAMVLSMLVEGNSMRSIERITGVSFNAISRLVDQAGKACKLYHDKHVRRIVGKRNIQVDELWAFVFAKEKNVPMVTPYDEAGSVWTFTALDAESKLIVSYFIRMGRDTKSAQKLLRDLRSRVLIKPLITADGLPAYRKASDRIWGSKANLYQLRKGEGEDNTGHTTAHVERSNLTIRTKNRRYTRKTNAFSKKMSRHKAAMHLTVLHYNFCCIHGTLRVTPAMEAGISDTQGYCTLAAGV